jgi:hypothetical protein
LPYTTPDVADMGEFLKFAGCKPFPIPPLPRFAFSFSSAAPKRGAPQHRLARAGPLDYSCPPTRTVSSMYSHHIFSHSFLLYIYIYIYIYIDAQTLVVL